MPPEEIGLLSTSRAVMAHRGSVCKREEKGMVALLTELSTTRVAWIYRPSAGIADKSMNNTSLP